MFFIGENMLTVLLVLQIIITLSMIVVILIQRSSSDGMAGLAGGGNSLMSGRASANLLTRITSILAAIFIANSLLMATMTARSSLNETSIIDEISVEEAIPAVPLIGSSAEDKNSPATSNDGGAVAKGKKDSKPAAPIAE